MSHLTNTIKLTRRSLYALVWSRTIVQISRELNVHQLHIAKACDENHIARPPVGYWQKLAYGKSVTVAELSNVRFAPDAIVELKCAVKDADPANGAAGPCSDKPATVCSISDPAFAAQLLCQLPTNMMLRRDPDGLLIQEAKSLRAKPRSC